MLATKIPATVITGFLGSGKTTLIRHLLNTAAGKRIALIINEFGDLGVDGEVLKGCGQEQCSEDDIVELTNGCICCTVADDFVPTMEQLLQRDPRPDHIVIETSGLALPQPLLNAFSWPDIREQVTVDGVVTVVDSKALLDGQFAADPEKVQQQRDMDEALDHETPLESLFDDQLSAADMIVLNKIDLVEPEDVRALERGLSEKVPLTVKQVRASNGAIDASVLLGLDAAAENDTERHTAHHHEAHHHDPELTHEETGHHKHGVHDDEHHHYHDHHHDEFESFALKFGLVSDRAQFLEQLGKLLAQSHVLRLKGFVDVKGKPMRLVVQAVGKRIDSYFDRDWGQNEERCSHLVVIGLAGLNQAEITAQIRALAGQAHGE